MRSFHEEQLSKEKQKEIFTAEAALLSLERVICLKNVFQRLWKQAHASQLRSHVQVRLQLHINFYGRVTDLELQTGRGRGLW